MADGSANGSPTRMDRGSHSICHSICVPAAGGDYEATVRDPKRFREWLAGAARLSPELEAPRNG